jgi:hypothetical protein
MSSPGIKHRHAERAAAILPACAGKPLLLSVVVIFLLSFSVFAAPTKPLAVLEGKLVTTRGDCPLVEINGHNQPLTAYTPALFHTLQDKRLNGREVRLEGLPQPDGSFQVQWLYTVHNGKLFRVRYFCSTCNIVALEPGNCVCCQQPTELQEIPVDKQDN